MNFEIKHVVSCPKCNGTMAAVQTERGAFFVCDCGHEVPVSEQGTVEEYKHRMRPQRLSATRNMDTSNVYRPEGTPGIGHFLNNTTWLSYAEVREPSRSRHPCGF